MPLQKEVPKESWSYKPGKIGKPSSSEIKKWKDNLQKNVRRGYKQGILWDIDEANHLGLPEDHPDVIMAKSVLASLPNGEGSHPSRTEITGVEPMCARWDEGSLAKAMVYGDAGDFEKAMGEFIAMMEFDSPPPTSTSKHTGLSLSLSSKMSTCSTASGSEVPLEEQKNGPFNALFQCDSPKRFGPSREEQKKALSTVIADVWRSADIDGNGLMSQSEARETLRVFLSRPQLRQALGGPLKTVIAQRMAGIADLAEVVDLMDPLSDCLSHMVHDRVLRLCKHAVSKSCMDVARHLPEMTESFWAAMDLNQNGAVDRDEFMRSFEDATRKVVIARLWARAEDRAWKMVEAECWKATTTEKMDEMLKTHIQNEKQKRKEVIVEIPKAPKLCNQRPKLPSAKDEAGEFCQAGDCSIM